MVEPLRLMMDRIETPVGELIIIADRDGNLRTIHFMDREDRLMRQLQTHYGRNGFLLEPKKNPANLTSAMEAYINGDLSIIDDLPVATGGTQFQRTVWAELRKIPCGETISYSELACRIDNPAAVRAVGLANGANPISIVVPCHRVIGANGTLTGYGGGIERKRWLLAHEARARQDSQLALEL